MSSARAVRILGTLLVAAALVRPEPAAPVSPPAGRSWTIGFVPKLVGIPYFEAMRRGLERGGAAFGARIVYEGPRTASVPGQIAVVQSLIGRHLDAVGVSANSSSLLGMQAASARDAGVLFFSSDSQVEGADVDLRVDPATPDAIAAAVTGQMVARIGEQGRIVLVSGAATADNLENWIVAIKRRVAEAYPGLRILDTLYVSESVDEAARATANLLLGDPGIRGVIGVNSTATAGAAKAVRDAGLAGRVAVAGIADPNAIRPYLDDGIVKSTVSWNAADLGYLTVWGIVRLLRHGTFAATEQVPGLPGPVGYDARTRTLLLGKPLVITAADADLDF